MEVGAWASVLEVGGAMGFADGAARGPLAQQLPRVGRPRAGYLRGRQCASVLPSRLGALLTLLGLVVLGSAVGSGRRPGFVGTLFLEKRAYPGLGDRSIACMGRVGARRPRGRSGPIAYRAV